MDLASVPGKPTNVKACPEVAWEIAQGGAAWRAQNGNLVGNEQKPLFDLEDLRGKFEDIVRFATNSRVETGFGYLNLEGKPDPDKPAELWITCRMTHVFALAANLGIPGAAELAEFGVESLWRFFQDPVYGGWFAAIETVLDGDGQAVPVVEDKQAYAHAFVLLAATSAFAAGIPGASRLFTAARQDQDLHWFREHDGRVVEAYDRSFSKVEDYRGLNSNMHTVEAYTAAYDVTGDRVLLDRAVQILRFVAHLGSTTNWRLPEHFTADWLVQADYNADRPADPFRPFGATPGHGLEWSRLMLQARAALLRTDGHVPDWMLPAAIHLYQRAVADGWDADGAPGFIYTTDMAGMPVVRERMHWVVFEAINAGIVLAETLKTKPEGLEAFTNSLVVDLVEEDVVTWWEYAESNLLAGPGRWTHELDSKNQASSRTWSGHPDAYHVAQMLLLPCIADGPTFAAALMEQTRPE